MDKKESLKSVVYLDESELNILAVDKDGDMLLTEDGGPAQGLFVPGGNGRTPIIL